MPGGFCSHCMDEPCSCSKDELGMYRLEDPAFHRVVVCGITICKQTEGRVWIDDNGSDASSFCEKAFATHVKEFYDKHF